MKKPEGMLLLAAILQLTCVYMLDYFFTKDVHETIHLFERSLLNSGMTKDQVDAMSLVIRGVKANVSWFVLSMGVFLILINNAVSIFLLRLRGDS